MKKRLTILTCFMVLCSFVFGQNHWTPNTDLPDGTNMTLTSVIVINGVEQTNTQLEIGAFYGNEVRGSAKLMHRYFEYNGQVIIDRYYAYQTILGVPGETYSFKLYDHATQQELQLVSNNAISFNQVTGDTETNPYVINFFTPVAEVDGVKYPTFEAAIAAVKENSTLALLDDVTISQKINVTSNLTINGNGKTLTYTGQDRAIDVASAANGANLTVTNLTVDCNASYCQRGINYNTTGKLVLDGVTVKGTNLSYALNMPGSADNATVTISNSTLKGCIALNVWGENSEINATNTTFTTVDNAEHEGYAAVALNNDGTTSAEGTTINIIGGAIAIEGNNADDSSASSNATSTGVINISETTEVEGEHKVMIAIISYGDNSYSFTTLAGAIEKANADETVLLIRNTEGPGVVINKDVTIDFGGKTYTFTSPAVGSTGTKTLGFQILKGNKVTLKNGTLNVDEDARTAFAMLIQNYADLTITDMTLDGDNLDRYTIKDYDYSYVLSNNSGEVSIEGKTNIIANPGDPTCEKEHRGIALDACKYSSYAAPIVTVNTTGEIKGIVEVSATLNLEAVGTNNISSVDVTGEGQLYNNIAIAGSVKRTFENDGDENTENDWYTIAVPFAEGHTTSALQTTTDYALYRYNESNIGAEWENVKVNSFNLDLGRGYIYANANNTDVVFTGTFNHESKSFKVTATDEAGEIKGFNLVGNPFSHDITFANLSHTSLAQGFYVLEGDGSWVARNNAGTIKAFQGALIQVGVGGEGNDLTINKNTAKSRSNGDVNGSIAINVANSKYSDVAYVSFNEGLGLTKISHRNAEVPMVYVPVEGKNYAVATMSNDVEEIPFSFEAKTMGQYTISIDAEDSDFARVILVDRLTGEETNMLFEDYTFMAKSNDNPERFVLKLTSKSEMNSNNDDFVYIYKNELFISSTADNAVVEVYDVLGRPVATYNVNGSTNISMDNFSNGVYIVRMIEENDVKVQKILID